MNSSLKSKNDKSIRFSFKNLVLKSIEIYFEIIEKKF